MHVYPKYNPLVHVSDGKMCRVEKHIVHPYVCERKGNVCKETCIHSLIERVSIEYKMLATFWKWKYIRNRIGKKKNRNLKVLTWENRWNICKWNEKEGNKTKREGLWVVWFIYLEVRYFSYFFLRST